MQLLLTRDPASSGLRDRAGARVDRVHLNDGRIGEALQKNRHAKCPKIYYGTVQWRSGESDRREKPLNIDVVFKMLRETVILGLAVIEVAGF